MYLNDLKKVTPFSGMFFAIVRFCSAGWRILTDKSRIGAVAQQTFFTKSIGPRFSARLVMNILGLFIAARLSRNIDYQDSLWVVAVAGLIFSLVNAFIRPLVIILALPAIVLSLGLFMLVVNGLMVLLVSKIYPPFEVLTFGAAVWAAIIVWIVNYGLSMFFSREEKVGVSNK